MCDSLRLEMYSTITVIEFELSSMTFVVPFDGSGFARSALARATEFGSVFDRDVVTISVIPDGNTAYARENGWIGPRESFDLDSVLAHLEELVREIIPVGEFRYALVDRYAPPGTIANRIRRLAVELDATMVFVGSDNAGRMVTSLGSVGGSVAADAAYDVVIVRTEIDVEGDERPKEVERSRLRTGTPPAVRTVPRDRSTKI